MAFLCFEHHDKYDSRTSQSKGLIEGEVRKFRTELYDQIDDALAVGVHFGSMIVPKEDPIAGDFIRIGSEHESAEINLTPIPDGPDGAQRYAVTGFAIWGGDQVSGPNIGEFAFIANLEDNRIEHYENVGPPRDSYGIHLVFENEKLYVKEDGWTGVYGMNVYFEGEYRRA